MRQAAVPDVLGDPSTVNDEISFRPAAFNAALSLSCQYTDAHTHVVRGWLLVARDQIYTYLSEGRFDCFQIILRD